MGLKKQIEFEIKKGDKLFIENDDDEGNDNKGKGEIKFDLELELGMNEKELKKKKCKVCKKKFGIFRTPMKCGKCSALCCKRCGNKFMIPSLDPLKKSNICDLCFPSIKSEIDN